MTDDKWAEAWSYLTNAVEHAYEAGMTEQEIQDAVEEAKPSDEIPATGGRKKKKK